MNVIDNRLFMSKQLMFFHPAGIESYGFVQRGQGRDPISPHHMDQSKRINSQGKFKPTRSKKEDLVKHLESTEALTFS